MNYIIKKIKKLIQISWINTLRFNFYYFGFKGLYKLPVIVSKNIYIDTMKGQVYIENNKPGIIKLGFGDVGIFSKKYDKGIWRNTGDIFFKGKASIGHGSKISNSSKLELGENFTITAKSEIVCCENIKFGDNCLISWDTLIMDTDFHKVYDKENNQMNLNEAITIGDNVWIGCRSLILKGAYIPTGCIIAANTTITKKTDFEQNTLLGGTNKILKRDILWKV